MKIVNVVGARPNFMKIAPLLKEMHKHADITALLIHTGQHYDINMAGQFFEDLEIPPPDVSLEVGSGSHAYQTAEVMKRLEPILEREHPDLVIVVGDVNSTLAAALTAVKVKIPAAHVEAGLRSFDRSMPEEINRLLTDAVSEYLFVTEESGRQNLLAEGIREDKIFFVGNVMIDSLEASRRLWTRSSIHEHLGLRKGQYGVVTLHRPSNVDDHETLKGIVSALCQVSRECPLVFPVHPRTRKTLEAMSDFGSTVLWGDGHPPIAGIHCMDPIGYLDFMALVANARIVLTDSGGLQEETTVLGIPCLTLRENTERPVTLTHGTNHLVGSSPEKIIQKACQVLEGPCPLTSPPPLWDGKASQRIVAILHDQVKSRAKQSVSLIAETLAPPSCG